LKSYKKLIPALREFPEDILITADDDCLYPFDWFAKLKASYLAAPEKIHCHRAHEILVDGEHYPLAYASWRKRVPADDFAGVGNNPANPAAIFPSGAGGILYPPHSLDARVFLTTDICPTADDIGFWAMAKLARKDYVVVPDGYREDNAIDEKISIHRYVRDADYDKQLAAVLKQFPELKENIFDNIEPATMVHSMYYAPEWRAREIANNWDGKIELPMIMGMSDSRIAENSGKMLPVIPVVLATDDTFAPFCAVTVQSILEHSNPQREYRIYIFQRELTSETMEKIIAQAALYPHCRIEFLNVMPLFEKIPLRMRLSKKVLSKDAYARLLIPYIFTEYEKVIYIDSDTLVMTDIAELYDTDLQGKALGACVDHNVYDIRKYSPEDVEKWTKEQSLFKAGLFSYDKEYLYFNSGVLIFDIQKFAEQVELEKMMRLSIFHSNFLEDRLHDQDILNSLFNKNYYTLPMLWNFFWYTGKNTEKHFEYVETHWQEAKIVHFTNPQKKPWNSLYPAALGNYFREYATRIPLYAERALDAEIKLKLKNFINPQKAYEMGFREVIAGFNAVGDSLITLAWVKIYYEKTGKKLLLITGTQGENDAVQTYFAGSDFCFVLVDFSGNTIPTRTIVNDTLTIKNIYSKKHESYSFSAKFINWAGNHYRQNMEGEWFRQFVKKHYITVCCEYLGLEGEIEIKPSWELTDENKKFGRFVSESQTKQIAIISGGAMKYKTLPLAATQAIVDTLKDECFFVQLGTEKDELLDHVYDFRSKSLRQVAAVLHNSDLFVGTIGGLMHLARAMDCPAVIAYGAEPLEFEYYTGNSYVFSETPCEICASGELDPYAESCPYDYKCIRNIAPEKMVTAILEKLLAPREFPKQTDICVANPVIGMESRRNHLRVKRDKFL
jgi:lipopolysaccharide biosynthesis glycosyltransferase